MERWPPFRFPVCTKLCNNHTQHCHINWLPVLTHWSLYRLNGFFVMKEAYMVLDIFLKLVNFASKAISIATAILLYKNNRL